MAGVRQLTLKFTLCSVVFLTSCQRTVTWPASVIHMADRTVERQLLGGFHAVEGNRWRWTAREFGVLLRPPGNAEKKGARLLLECYLPQRRLDTLGPVTVFAKADETPLEEQTFFKEGAYRYTRYIPPDLLATTILPVHFRLSKAVHPSSVEGRELGAVVTQIGLELN